MKTKWKKIDNNTYVVIVDNKLIGKVKTKSNWKWILEPYFSLIIDDLQDILFEYDDYIEAGRAMVGMWYNKQEYDLAFLDFQNHYIEYDEGTDEEEYSYFDYTGDFSDT
jgi:hypothetical protein